MPINEKALTTHKLMMIKTLMKCTNKVILLDGMDAVTIRKVADCSRLNSATIYNYFDNLEHLIIFSSMGDLDEYIKALPEWIENSENSLDILIKVWECFAHYSYIKPRVYSKIFFSNYDKDMTEYIDEFYGVFPLDVKDYPDFLMEMLNASNIYERDLVLIRRCAVDGYFNECDMDDINNMLLYTYEGILLRVNKKKISAQEAEEQFKRYLLRIIDSYIIK